MASVGRPPGISRAGAGAWLVEAFERGHEIADAPELAIHGGEAHVGNLAHVAEPQQDQFTDLVAAHLPGVPLLDDEL